MSLSVLNLPDLNDTDLENLPVSHTINNAVNGYSFLVNQTMQAAHQTADQKDPENTTIRVFGDYIQVGMGSCGSPWVMDIWAPRT